MKKCLMTIFLCAVLLLAILPEANITTVFASESIELTFSFQDKEFSFDTSKNEYSNNFYFSSKAQQRKIASRIDRAQTLDKLISMGIEPCVALNYCLPGFKDFLSNMQNTIECEPKDATYSFSASYPHFSFKHEKVGYKLDTLELANQIHHALVSGENRVNLTPTKILPKVYYDDIKDYNNIRSHFSTTYLDNPNREHNIMLALRKLDGLTILPNTEYSFNEIVGKRTQGLGYKEAKIIIGGKYIEGVGGGVCQVSTTLYNALLLAGVNITEVHNHTLASSYVKLGFDAMVNFGIADLKWNSKLAFPLFVSAKTSLNSVDITIWGKPNMHQTIDRVVEIEEEKLPPPDEIVVDENGEYCSLVEYEDEEAYIQLPHKGYKVRSILEIYENGELVERKLIRRSVYSPCAGIKVVGIKKRNNLAE